MTRGAALAFLCVAGAACAAPAAPWRPTWRAPYARFDGSLRRDFLAARTRLDAGQTAAAWVALDGLADSHPDNLELLIWRQEAEGLLLESRADLPPGLDFPAPGAPPEERLRLRYADLTEAAPSVTGFVLAARVEADAIAAQRLLDRALELDPRCAWAYYGRAHALLRQDWKADRWREARASLDRALDADPAHLRARRLEAWMDAQEGRVERAAGGYETWLEAVEGDPRVAEDERRAAELDLAATWILAGRPGDARALLLARQGEALLRARRLALLAVAEQELGDLDAALDAAQRAADAAPEELLPLVQIALLLQYERKDTVVAEETWRRIAREAGGRGDLAAMLQNLRARVEVERAGDARRAP